MDLKAVAELFIDHYDDGLLKVSSCEESGASAQRKRPVAAPVATLWKRPVGVFAACDIKKRRLLGKYTGEHTSWRVDREDVPADDEFVFRLGPSTCLDPTEITEVGEVRLLQACAAHFVRQPLPGKRVNAKFVVDDMHVSLFATVDIKQGQEIYAGYGNQRLNGYHNDKLPRDKAECARRGTEPQKRHTNKDVQIREAAGKEFAEQAAGAPRPRGKGASKSAPAPLLVVTRISRGLKEALVEMATAHDDDAE